MRAGVVLAGGRSERFGDADKALAEFAGEALVCRVVDRIGGAVDELVVNCRAEQVGPIRRALDGAAVDPAFATDPVPDRGPAAGLATGLAAVTAPLAAVTACDMPRLDPAFLASLFDDAADRTGAVPVLDGYPQPLCAVYRAAPARRACRAALADGDGSLRDVVDRLGPAVVPEPEVCRRTDPATFRNVNTPADLDALAPVAAE